MLVLLKYASHFVYLDERTILEIPVELTAMKQTIAVFKKENTKLSWKALENMVLFSKYPTEFTNKIISELSIEKCLKFELSKEFLSIFLKSCNLSFLTEKDIKSLLEKGCIDAVSTYIIRKGNQKSTLDSTLMIALRYSLAHGKYLIILLITFIIPSCYFHFI